MLKRSILSKVSLFALTGVLLVNVPSPGWAMEQDEEGEGKGISVSSLPNEVALTVFEYLSPKTLSKVALVSKGWDYLANVESLWGRHLPTLGLEKREDLASKPLVIAALQKNAVNEINIEMTTSEQNDVLVKLGYKCAIETEIKGRTSGRWGYPKSPDHAREINDSRAAKGDIEATLRKAHWFICGTQLYKEPQCARHIIEKLVAQNVPEAIEIQIEGYSRGAYGFPKTPTLAYALNEIQADKGNHAAKMRRIEGYSSGCYGYQKDSTIARKLNEQEAEAGNFKAIQNILGGLLGNRPEFGYEQNDSYAADYFRWMMGLKVPKAFNYKAISLEFGQSFLGGEPLCAIDLPFLKGCIEELALEGHPEAIAKKVVGRAFGKYGYQKDPSFLPKYLELLAE